MDGDASAGRTIGDNSRVLVEGATAADLRGYVERVERLNEERKQLAADAKDVLAEAKARGFDVAVIRAVIRLRQQEPAHREEHAALLDVYCRALGM
ncbi:MAG: DUF2312 domain-containing protein [Patescibacteria group bacterium]|nr:DUF2312 domain-containing protein [Patescibacteria group bacterium]